MFVGVQGFSYANTGSPYKTVYSPPCEAGFDGFKMFIPTLDHTAVVNVMFFLLHAHLWLKDFAMLV